METKTKKLKLSNSAIDKYKTCAYMYHLHYNKRIRDTGNPSPLIFGIALDEAFNILLLRKKPDLTEEEKELVAKYPTPHSYLKEKMAKVKWETVDFNRADFDENLMSEEEKKLPEHERGYLSLLRKGNMMLDAYEKEIMPLIARVHSIQCDNKLINAEGDELVSKADFIADWKELGNKVLFDNKTSSKKYPKNAVIDSQQLSIYSEAEEVPVCGYIVCVKKLDWTKQKACRVCGHKYTTAHRTCNKVENKVRCNGEVDVEYINPKVIIQVIIDEIPIETKDIVFDEIERHANSIKNERFDKNWDSCYQYGRKCPYYFYCREGKMDGLKNLGERNGNKRKSGEEAKGNES